MTRPRFLRLLAAELRLLLGERLTWAILAALTLALALGAMTGAERVVAERAAIARAATDEARAVSEARAAHERYGRPGPLKVSYWQDPTHAFGYMTQFLTAHAVKPPTPLALVATGQSDVQPTLMRVSFAFGAVFEDTAYDLGAVGRLKLGPFDLAFVLVTLLPLAVIALAGTRLSAEQDSGILRMIAAQPVSPRRVAAAKFGAAALVALGGVLGGTGLALACSGISGIAGWETVLCRLGLALVAYTLFWVAACALAASLWRGGVAALVMLVLAWACLVVALPAALNLAVGALAPMPSRIAAIDASRQAQDRFYNGTEGPKITAAWLSRHEPDAGAALREAPEIRRLARDAFYDTVLDPHRRAFRDHARAAASWSRRLALLSPATALTLALESAAGTDAGRHAAFLAAAATYRRDLRSFFEPRILAQALHPRPVCEGCQARLDFNDYDEVPAFMPSLSAATAERQTGTASLALLAAAFFLTALAWYRFARWPA